MNHRRTTVLVILTIVLLVAGCRRLVPTSQLHPASEPDISRIILNNGDTVKFNVDFGWFNVEDSLIQGTSIDSQAVSVPLRNIREVETVRYYAVFFFYFVALVAMGAAAYLLYLALNYTRFLP